MKKLLALTDFTPNAAHAAAAAVHLSRKLGADLILYHAVQYITPVPDYTFGSAILETEDSLLKDSTERLKGEARSLESQVAQLTGYQPRIDIICGEGNLAQDIKVLSHRQDIGLIVMGGMAGGTLDHLLTGSETVAVTGAARKPVLVIPEEASLTSLKKIVFATDFGTADISAVRYLLEMAELLNIPLEVLHVVRPGEVVTEIGPEVAFRGYLNSLDAHRVSYKMLTAADVSKRLQDYCHETDAAMLAMTHVHHHFISRAFGRSQTKEAMAAKHLAVLIFPPEFEEN